MHYPKVSERVVSPEQIFHRSFSLGAPEQFRPPPFFTSTSRKLDLPQKVSLHSSVRQSFYSSYKTTWNWPVSFTKFPVFPECKGYGNQTSLISPTCRVKWSFKPPWKSLYKVVFARGPPPGEGQWQMHKHQKLLAFQVSISIAEPLVKSPSLD